MTRTVGGDGMKNEHRQVEYRISDSNQASNRACRVVVATVA